jgi:hypothetical protein
MTPTPDTEAPVQDVPPNDTPATDTVPSDLTTPAPEQAPTAAPEDPLTSTSAGAEPFTNADGTPGPIVTEAAASGADLAVPSTPVLIASVALYREPDGSFSIVREHAPQTFHKTVGELVHQATEYVEQRLKHVGL